MILYDIVWFWSSFLWYWHFFKIFNAYKPHDCTRVVVNNASLLLLTLLVFILTMMHMVAKHCHLSIMHYCYCYCWPYWYLYWQWCTWWRSVVNNACFPLLTVVTLARINDEHGNIFHQSKYTNTITQIHKYNHTNTQIQLQSKLQIGLCFIF